MPSRLELLREMLEKDPKDPFLHYALALEYIKGADTDKAIEVLIALTHESPDYLASYYQLGKLLEAQDTEKAKAYYKKGIDIARQQKNMKTLGELNEALALLED
jgi:tetratricopeptide (TPR) repeat protein